MSQKALNLNDYWHFACHISELEHENSFVNIKFHRTELFILKENNKYKAYENICMHRGSKLVQGDKGIWNKKCPYHGVIYENGIPINVDELGLKKSKKRIHLIEFKIQSVGEFLFFTSYDNPKSFEEQYGIETFDHLKKISEIIENPLSDDSYTYDCRWEVAIENALEPLHLEEIHPETLNTLQLSKAKNREYDESIIWDHEVENKKIFRGLKKLKKLFAHDFNECYHSSYLFPFFFISSTFGYSFSIQTFFPGSEKFETNFRSRVFSSKLKDEKNSVILKSFFKSTVEVNKRIFAEDAEICSNLVKKDPHFIGPIADTEEKILWFRKKLRNFDT